MEHFRDMANWFSELQGVDTFLLLVQGVRMTEATLHGGAQDQRL